MRSSINKSRQIPPPPVGEEIVQTNRKLFDIEHHKHHNRHRHWIGYPPEPAQGDRRSGDHNRRGHVRWPEGVNGASAQAARATGVSGFDGVGLTPPPFYLGYPMGSPFTEGRRDG